MGVLYLQSPGDTAATTAFLTIHYPVRRLNLEVFCHTQDFSVEKSNDSSRIRTYDRFFRRELLYPSELLSHELIITQSVSVVKSSCFIIHSMVFLTSSRATLSSGEVPDSITPVFTGEVIVHLHWLSALFLQR